MTHIIPTVGWGCPRCVASGDGALLVCTEQCDDTTRGYTEAQCRQRLDAFPFPLAGPVPDPVMVTLPCGCTSMDVGDGSKPVQVSWCVPHDPGYEPAEEDL